jgi:predicted transcriptional regulator
MTKRQKKLSDRDIRSIIYLRQMGMPIAHIARSYEVSVSTINYHAKHIPPWSVDEILEQPGFKELYAEAV